MRVLAGDREEKHWNRRNPGSERTLEVSNPIRLEMGLLPI